MRIAGICLIVSLAAAGAAAARPCDSSPLLVFNVGIWTPEGIIERQDVLFRNGRIAEISSSATPHPKDVRRIDGSGHTLLPGLIDAHLHFVVPGGLPASGAPRTDASEITGRQLLRSGVTAGRLHLASLESAAELKRRSADDCAPLPRLQVGGPGFGGAATTDGAQFWSVQSIADAGSKVERVRAAGLDWIAVHDADRFPADVLDAIVASARKAGIRLMASGTRPEEIEAVLGAYSGSPEGPPHRPDTLDYFDQSDQATYSPDLLRAIARTPGLVLVPTLGIYERIGAYLARAPLLEDPANFEFLRPDDRAYVLAAARKDLAGNPLVARVRRVLPLLRGKVTPLRQLGVPFALGSDAGSQLHFQTNAIWWELEAWRTLGASHREALVAATHGGARVLAATDIGRLTVGSRADFVLYRGHVERGPFEASRVIAVGKGGVLFVNERQWIGR